MTYRKSMTAALVLTTILGGSDFAAEQDAQQSGMQSGQSMSASQKAVDADIGKLSKDGAQGFRDLQLTRIAIFEADPAQAKDMIGKAQAAFAKAKTDDAVFTKAEADLKTPTDVTGEAPARADAKPASKEQVAWVPVDAQLTLGDDFVATPAKASAVTEANKNLAQGDQKGALEKLKLAHVDVNFTMAVLPLNKTMSDVDQAASLIGQGKYYEANAILKTAQDAMRFDVIDASPCRRRKAATADRTAPQATGTTASAKAGKSIGLDRSR